MTTPRHDCAQQGHVWIEGDGSFYVRHRNRPKGLTKVHCHYCPALEELERFAAQTAPPISPPAPVKTSDGL